MFRELFRHNIERVCRQHFKFDENGRKLSKWVENTVRKGEIACYEQFFLFPQCFQQACFPGASKGVIVWEWVNDPRSYDVLLFTKQQHSRLIQFESIC